MIRRVLLAALAVSLISPGAAVAASPQPPTKTAITPVTPPVTVPPPVTSSPGATGVLGASDVLQGLGATDANCTNPTGRVAVNCKSDSFAATAYPPSNYGLDVSVDRGLSHPEGWAMGPLQDLLSAFFTVLVYIVAGAIIVLSAAMSLDIFKTQQAQIAHILNSATTSFTWPLMIVAVVIIGGYAAYYVAHRRIGRAATYVIGTCAAIVLTLVVLGSPGSTLGPVDDLANGAAAVAPGALTGNSPGTGGFAQAESAIWKAAVETPWCALEFGNPTWCMQAPDAAMRAAAADVSANHMDDALGNQDTNGVLSKNPQVQAQERQRMADAQTNGQLFLSFVTNADVRNGKNDKWTFYNVVAREHPELLSARGPGGLGTRIPILLFGMIAGTFFLMLLVFIAWQIACAALFFLILLIAGALMLFAVLFGEAGWATFKLWASTLLGTVLIKVLYAFYLGIMLAVTLLVLSFNLGWYLDWMALALVWSIGWFKRKALMDMFSAGHHAQHDHTQMVGVAGGFIAGRTAQYMTQRRATSKGVQSAAEHYETREGDSNYHLHLHADPQANGNGHHPERVAAVAGDIEGHVNELEE